MDRDYLKGADLMREQTANRVFDTINFIILFICTLICLAPFLHILAISLSSVRPILSGQVSLFPVELNFEAYYKVFSDPAMIRSLGFTVMLTGLFTVMCMAMTSRDGLSLVQKEAEGPQRRHVYRRHYNVFQRRHYP